MTLPFEYQNPTLQLERFMVDARNFADLPTTNMTWNIVVGVLHAFRARLSVHQALAFAAVLPPIIRALFIEDWDINKEPVVFGGMDDWLKDVRAVRTKHNFAPDNSVEAVAAALRRQVDPAAFARTLSQLPPEASVFWQAGKTGDSGVAPSVA